MRSLSFVYISICHVGPRAKTTYISLIESSSLNRKKLWVYPTYRYRSDNDILKYGMFPATLKFTSSAAILYILDSNSYVCLEYFQRKKLGIR